METTNVAQAVAWRLRFTRTGERRLSREAWTFDFGKDFKCWPVSHAQGPYIPKTLGTLASMKRAPGLARVTDKLVVPCAANGGFAAIVE